MEAEKTLLDINHALGLAGPGQRARAELLAHLLRDKSGGVGRDRPWGDYEVVSLLRQTLHDDLIRLQETRYEGAERMAASWPLPLGLGLRRRIFRGMARRSFERYRARLLG